MRPKRHGKNDPGVERHVLRMLIIGVANWAPEWYRETAHQA
ncbi:hypothetical protein [Candidatus Binatus sp.]